MTDRLSALQVFFRVVETESFSAVARELGLSQPTVSRQVAALEEHLGARLLTRTTRRVAPTDAGRALYERGARAVRDLLEAEDEIRAGGSELRGPVRVAVPGAVGRRLVLPLVCSFLEQHKAVTVDLFVSDRPLDFVEGGIDLAVRMGKPSEASLAMRVLGHSDQRFVAAPRYVAGRGRPARLEDLAGHALVTRRQAGGQPLGRMGPGGAQIEGEQRLAADDVETVYAAVLSGLGIGILPRWLVEEDIHARRLVPLLPDAPRISAPIVAVYPQDRRLPRRVRALLDALVEGLTARFAGLGEE